MNKSQNDDLNSYYSIRTVLGEFESVWEGNAIFSKSVLAFEDQIPKIEKYRAIQKESTSGVTISKSAKRDELIVDISFYAGRIVRYAYDINDLQLVQSYTFTDSFLVHTTDIDLAALGNKLLDTAVPIITKLVPYSITQALMDAFRIKVNVFSNSINEPRTADTASINATIMLENLFLETETILVRGLDLDIEVFRVSHPDFYNQYQAARNVVASATRKVAVIGKAIEKTTENGIKGVKFIFNKVNVTNSADFINVQVKKMTAKKGSFRISNLSEGKYEVTVSKTGYKAQKITINIVNGETSKPLVELEKED
jgi:hypothetical protein